MDDFIVSARKYRPATFDTVVGQDHITTTLKNAIRTKTLAQAFLFTGPRGVGKTTCARIFAKTINCLNLDENIEPCNACESCLSFNRSASFNIFELDAASNSSVNDIRNLVDQVRIPPQSVQYKVYIIDEVHMLSQMAFNAFLKTLEEPPLYAKFILATTEKHKIIPTILSRCQIYDFKRITVRDIAKYLAYVANEEGVIAEPEALQVIAHKADGAMRDALSIFDQLVSFTGKELNYKLVVNHLNVLDYDYYFKITDFLLSNNIYDTLLLFNKVIESGFDGQHFISGLGAHFRDLLVCTDDKTVDLLEVGEKIKDLYLEQSARCTPNFLINGLDIIQKTDFNYKTSSSKRLHIEIALMQLASINETLSADKKAVLSTDKVENKNEPIVIPSTPKPQKTLPTTASTQKPAYYQSVTKEKKEITKTKPPQVSETLKLPYIPTTISIKDEVIEKDDGQENEEAENFDFESEEFLNAKTIQTDQLLQVWNDFATKISDANPNLYSTLVSTNPEIEENFIITFEVHNALQEHELNRKKNELVAHLRNELDNPFIQLKILLNTTNVQTRPYKPDEIYQHMLAKNPIVADLKQKFGLSLEY